MKLPLLPIVVCCIALLASSCENEASARGNAIAALEPRLAGPMHELVEPLANLRCPSFDSPSEPSGTDARLTKIAKTLWERIDQTPFDWDHSSAEATKQQVDDMLALHKWVSSAPGYGNVFLSAACEHKLSRALALGLVRGKLQADEVKAKLAVIRANRLNQRSIGDFIAKELPESKTAEKIAGDLKRGTSVDIMRASADLIHERGEDLLNFPQVHGDLLVTANPERVLQYSATALNLLDMASGIADYIAAGGNVFADQPTLLADLETRIPHFFEGKSAVTGESPSPMSLVNILQYWLREEKR